MKKPETRMVYTINNTASNVLIHYQDNVLSDFAPRRKGVKCKYAPIIEKDHAIQRYFNLLKSKPKANGKLSDHTRRLTLYAIRDFLKYIRLPITDHTITDLIQHKKELPNTDDKLEEQLEYFSNTEPVKTHRNKSNFIKGVFKANRCRLDVFVDNHFTSNTQPISEGILKQIHQEQPKEHQLLMSYQGYSGQRIEALSNRPIDQETITIGNYTALLIYSHQNKSRIDHYTIIPTKLYTQMLNLAKKSGRTVFFPNYRRLWQEITEHAKAKHDIKLTSHYLRKRYTSIAQETPMPVNHYDYLQGSQPQSGHCANTYLLKDLKKFAQEYHTYLSHALNLTTYNDQTNAEPYHSNHTNNGQNTHDHNLDTSQTILKELRQLRKEIQDLKSQKQQIIP